PPVVHASQCTYAIFFFQAEDGIRDFHVTGVQTCALPIWEALPAALEERDEGALDAGAAPSGEAARGGAEVLVLGGADLGVVRERSEERRVGNECGARCARGTGMSSKQGQQK